MVVDPNLEKKIEATYRLVQENHKMLKRIRRSIFLGHVMRLIYWFILIGVAASAYIFLQPYVETLLAAYSSITGQIEDFTSLFKN